MQLKQFQIKFVLVLQITAWTKLLYDVAFVNGRILKFYQNHCYYNISRGYSAIKYYFYPSIIVLGFIY